MKKVMYIHDVRGMLNRNEISYPHALALIEAIKSDLRIRTKLAAYAEVAAAREPVLRKRG